ncbi:MAG: hypothetical protein NZ554_09640 [Bryobacteraceae bacterium]|nr:hypothetical protein [Bryobacteraceae bacterium]
MAGARSLLPLLAAACLHAQGPFYPLEQVRPGMKGVGRTVFAGDRIEEFAVEILGVLENVGPKQSLVLARLSGGPLEKAGILQGMSGSPVYLEGRLLGAVAMAFPFSKEPIGAIRPIQDMLALGRIGEDAPRPRQASLFGTSVLANLPRRPELVVAGNRLVEIGIPLALSGFTRRTVEQFGPELKAMGLEPREAVSSGGGRPAGYGNPSDIKPGSMISVQLLAGDMSVGADGTVTYVAGNRIYAFGHRFLAVGRTELPFARSEVLAVVPTLATSFKVTAPREWMGTITEDRSTGVTGELGRRSELVPLSIEVLRQAKGGTPSRAVAYRMEMVRDRLLSPLLLQMAVFSVIDATEQALGRATFQVRGEFQFRDGSGPLRMENMFAGEVNLPLQVSAATAVPLAYVLQSGFDELELKGARLEIVCYPERRQLQIEQVWSPRRQVRPGENLTINLVLRGENQVELARQVTYAVPVGAVPGVLQITVSDGSTANLAEYQGRLAQPPKSPGQLIQWVNSLRPNTRAYVRIARAEPSFDVLGNTLSSAPPSLALVLGRSQAALGSGPGVQSSKLAELVVDAGPWVVTGSKNIQVEVKE